MAVKYKKGPIVTIFCETDTANEHELIGLIKLEMDGKKDSPTKFVLIAETYGSSSGLTGFIFSTVSKALDEGKTIEILRGEQLGTKTSREDLFVRAHEILAQRFTSTEAGRITFSDTVRIVIKYKDGGINHEANLIYQICPPEI